MMIKTVFIDVDNTLIDFNACALASMKEAFTYFGLPFSREVFSTFLKINNGLWEKIEKGTLTKKEHARIRWNLILEALHIDFDGPRLEEKFVDGLNYHSFPIEGAQDLVAYLSKKYWLCVTSNASLAQQINRLKIAGLYDYMANIYVSENVRFQKPAREFFEYCLNDLKIENKEEVIVIGDSLRADIQGANRVSMDSIWYNPKGLACTISPQPKYIVQDLKEIKKIL